MKCVMITHSAEETGQQKEQWDLELEVTDKWRGGEGWPKFEKGVVDNIEGRGGGGVFIK